MYAAIDIETIERPMPQEIRHLYEEQLIEKLTQQYKKEETIKAHLVDGMQSFKDKWKFSRQGCEVICIGVGLWSAKQDSPTVHVRYRSNEETTVRDALTLL